MSDNSTREAFLYIGLDLKSISPNNYAQFRGIDQVPVSWFFLFTQEDVMARQDVMPESIGLFQGEFENDPDYEQKFEQFVREPVALETTIPRAKERLSLLRDAFKQIPYFWSYFRVIDILDAHLEEQINTIAEKAIEDASPSFDEFHPDVGLSQVSVVEEEDEASLKALESISDYGFDAFSRETKKDGADESEEDNPFSDLLDIDMDTKSTADPVFNQLDSQLMDDLLTATELDQKDDEDNEEEEEDETNQAVYAITATFDHLGWENIGQRFQNLFLRIENLYHHILREGGKLTRVMIDIFQDIFQESGSNWKLSGVLSEDFSQDDPSRLENILLGDQTSYNLQSNIILDLEYWTKNTLQQKDEHLMYALSKLPSEELHEVIDNENFDPLAEQVERFLTQTRSRRVLRYTEDLLSRTPINSNIWAIRVLIPVEGKYMAATIIPSSINVSWKEDFLERIDLPGVLTDWNIDYKVRLSDFNDVDTYKIVFKRAEGKEDTYQGFIRWLRRHHKMYVTTYGVKGTIDRIAKKILETEDPATGQLLFTILTNLSEKGFGDAINALNHEQVVNKLNWFYSAN